MVKKVAWYFYIFLAIFLLSIATYFKFFYQEFTPTPDEVICDMEKVSEDFFITNGVYFNKRSIQSDDYSFSGKYSLKMDEENFYGISYLFKDVKVGDVINASVMVLGDDISGVLALKTSWGEWLIDRNKNPVLVVDQSGNQWKKLTLELKSKKIGEVKVYTGIHDNKSSVYLDDFKAKIIRKLK